MILADLERELARLVAADIADGRLPPQAASIQPGRTWRRAPGQNPATFATSIAFELAAGAGGSREEVAARLAASVQELPWITAAEPSGGGYLTITVTTRALADAATLMAAAGPAAARSSMLAGVTTTIRPWPDPAAAPSWRSAWADHTAVMTARLAETAGASASVPTTIGERPMTGAGAATSGPSSVADAVAWFGLDSVRYGLASTAPGRVPRLGELLRPGAWGADPLESVRQAHSSAAASLRWAAELDLHPNDPGDLLLSGAEQELLGLLAWLPVRVGAAAARHRPDELPSFLEEVSDAWLAVRQEAPALPFGGRAAPADSAIAGARLMLARATGAVLATGLALTGVSAAC